MMGKRRQPATVTRLRMMTVHLFRFWKHVRALDTMHPLTGLRLIELATASIYLDASGCKGGSRRPIFWLVSDRALGLEIDRRFPASFRLNFVGDFLAFIEALQARALDSADMDEHVLAAAVGLNESESFLSVEPLNCACSHYLYPVSMREGAH
jgi:hypothetical protein